MPYKAPIVCLKCEVTESSFWTNAENLGVICLDCVTEAKKDKDADKTGDSKEDGDGKSTSKKKTRAVKAYRTRHNPNATRKQSSVPKGKGRRSLFKKVPKKSPSQVATVITSDYVFHKGSYFQTGDIVSTTDEKNDCFYAQIIGLMTDQYFKKSVVIQWLLPTKDSPPPNEEFDPATYTLGPAEDLPRDLEYFDFVMHAPSDFYKSKTTPYVPIRPLATAGFIWSSMGSVKRHKE
ncbi:unnamed protein product [Ceutorhynchus assimilis]|uniref:GATA zinc finger domain-containing protein 1 n=1 Tax=Ceutorhynchus assimilis TaxID=467358 RepID=A0A9N9MDH0_9CUCU|nr:unnamed protein product [Ceutorhynchus assimilis]